MRNTVRIRRANRFLLFGVVALLFLSFSLFFRIDLFLFDKYSWYVDIGTKNWKFGKHTTGLSYAQKAIALDPEKKEGYILLTKEYTALRRFESAKKAVENLKGIDPFSYYRFAAWIFFKEDSLNKSIEYFKESIKLQKPEKLEPQHVNSYVGLGLAYLKSGNYNDSVQVLTTTKTLVYEESAAVFSQDKYKIHAGLAVAYQLQNELEKSKAEADIAESLRSNSIAKMYTKIY